MIDMQVESITPNQAAKYLEANGKNRPLKQEHVAFLAREMMAGDFQLTGQPIIFDQEANLLDGQHRLWAIIESGATVDLAVVRGAEADALDVIDTGSRPRSASDIFAMRGLKNCSLLSAGILVMDRCRVNGIWTKRNRRRLSQPEYDEYLELFPELHDWATIANRKGYWMLPRSLVCGMGVMFSKGEKADGDARMFFEALGSGTNLDAESPIHLLRNRLIRNKAAKVRELDTFLMGWYVIKSWNYYYQHRSLRRLTIGSTEGVPEIYGFDYRCLPNNKED